MGLGPAQAVFLGVIQGLTEFLPVSSSGHLVILQDWLGVQLPGLTFEVAVHGGTLAAVFFALGDRIFGLFRGLAAVLLAKSQDPSHRQASRLAYALMVGTIPAALAGLSLRRLWEAWFQLPIVSGVGLILTGCMLWFSGRIVLAGHPLRAPGPREALIIGLAQAAALTPGVSRSGSTIAAGFWVGVDRQTAAEFSFLLSIPAVGGAFLLDLARHSPVLNRSEVTALVLGAVAAAVSGYFAIRTLLHFLRAGRLRLFSYYTWVMGLLVIAVELLG